MSKPTASVAMATYNGERFLQEQLDSLARQTLLPYELVACDDCSTDHTLDILRRFAAEAPFPVRIYRNEKRLSYGPNFLRAASLCSGDLIAFCDQDDVWLEKKLDRCSAVISESESNLVIHSADVVDERLSPVGYRTSKIQRPALLDADAGRGWIPLAGRLREILDWVRGCTCVFRSRLLSDVPPVPPLAGPLLGHEYWLNFAAEVTGSITLIPDALILYRQHGRNAVGFRHPLEGLRKLGAALGTCQVEYSVDAQAAAGFANFLATAAAGSPQLLVRLRRAQRYYEERARSFSLRAALYSEASSVPETLRRLLSLILRGTYRARSQGGLGFKALAKDLVVLFLPRAAKAMQGERGSRTKCCEEHSPSPTASANTPSPIVSIIVNNYNYGRFVGEAIDSALAQTYPNVEVIVVDDGSTDNSREVIARYGERIIPVLKSNGGHASTFNAGFEASKGDLILFLDSDDMLEPNAIDTVVREWRDGLSRMHFLLQLIDAKGQTLGGAVGGAVSPGPMLGPFVSGASTTGNVLSRAALEKVMPIPDEEWKMSCDGYVCTTTSLFGETMRLGQPLGKYRIHGSNNHIGEAGLLYRTRRRVRLELSLYEAISRLTNGKIGSREDWLGRCPQHWVCRIRLLREGPQDYPWPDTLLGLTVRAVKAAWRQPDRKFHQRLAYSIYAAAYGLLPRKLTRLLGKAIPMARFVAVREHQRESDIMAQAAEHSAAGVRA